MAKWDWRKDADADALRAENERLRAALRSAERQLQVWQSAFSQRGDATRRAELLSGLAQKDFRKEILAQMLRQDEEDGLL